MDEGNPTKKAPGRLDLVRQFVNTVDFESARSSSAPPSRCAPGSPSAS